MRTQTYILKLPLLLFIPKILQVLGANNLVEQLAVAEQRLIRTHRYLNQPCKYDNYEEIMIPFWNDFFAPKLSRNDIITFKFTYSKIFVDFGPEGTDVTQIQTWRSLHDPSDRQLISETVHKPAQRKDEQERCMIGGLMTCDQKTSRCVCMDNPNWLQTNLVRIDTGEVAEAPPDGDPEWTKLGCFVKTGTRCGHDAYGETKVPFICTDFNLCDTTYGVDKCVEPFSS